MVQSPLWRLHVPLNKPDLNLHLQPGGDRRPCGRGRQQRWRLWLDSSRRGAVLPSVRSLRQSELRRGGVRRIPARSIPSVHRPPPPWHFLSEERTTETESGESDIGNKYSSDQDKLRVAQWNISVTTPPQHSIWRHFLDSRGGTWTPPTPKWPESNPSLFLR